MPGDSNEDVDVQSHLIAFDQVNFGPQTSYLVTDAASFGSRNHLFLHIIPTEINYILEVYLINMNINDLPVDCLIGVFNCNHNLNDLLQYFRVCSKWRESIKTHLRTINKLYLISMENYSVIIKKEANHVHTDELNMMEKVNVSELLPNLKFLYDGIKYEFMLTFGKCPCKAISNILVTAKSLIGLDVDLYCYYHVFNGHNLPAGGRDYMKLDNEIVQHCGNIIYLESGSTIFFERYFYQFKFGKNLKSLRFRYLYMIDFLLIASQLVNLEFIIITNSINVPWPEKYDKPVLPKLQELVLQYSGREAEILSFFPNLSKLFYLIDSTHRNIQLERFPVNNYVKQLCLCVYYPSYMIEIGQEREVFSYIKNFIPKFPNCAHLEIDGSKTMKKEDLFEILKSIPNLTSLHLNNIMYLGAQRARDIINEYNEETNRKIIFKLESKWI